MNNVSSINYINITENDEFININDLSSEISLILISANIHDYIDKIDKYFLGFINIHPETYVYLSKKNRVFYNGDTIMIKDNLFIFNLNRWMRLGIY